MMVRFAAKFAQNPRVIRARFVCRTPAFDPHLSQPTRLYDLRQSIEKSGKGYVMAVSGKAYVWMGFKQIRVSAMLASLPDEGWSRLNVGHGTKGERVYDWMMYDINTPSELPGQRKLMFRRSISKPDEICAYLCYSP